MVPARHAKALAAKGFDVTGIDLAPNSIAHALQFANDHLHFYEHDMRELFWINYFRYAFNFFTSFGYFKTNRENANAIRMMAQSICKDGVLVLDYLNTRWAEAHLIKQSEKTVEGIHFSLTKWSDEEHFFKEILIDDPSQPNKIRFMERVAKLSLAEFEVLFKNQGLQMHAVFGDYELNQYDEQGSPRLIMIAKKK